VKEELAELGRTFVRSIRDGVRAQLQLMAEVRALAAAPDSDLEARLHALLDEHHRDPEYLAHLRKAVASKLDSGRRIVRQLRDDQEEEDRQRSTEEHTADRVARQVTNSFISSRERKVSRLERLTSLLDEPGLVHDPGELPGDAGGPVALDPAPDESRPVILFGGTEPAEGRRRGRSWSEFKSHLHQEDLEEPEGSGDANEPGK